MRTTRKHMVKRFLQFQGLFFLVSMVLVLFVPAYPPDEYHLTTQNGALYLESMQGYACTGYQIGYRAVWIGNTLYLGITHIEPQRGGCFPMIAPATACVATAEALATGEYRVAILWRGGSRTYNLTKNGGFIYTETSDHLVTGIMKIALITPSCWVTLVGISYLLITLGIVLWPRHQKPIPEPQ